MNKKLIIKYDLLPTKKVIGNSFNYGVKVYQYKESIFLAQCNTIGEPSENVLLWNEKNNAWFKLTVDFLFNLPLCEFDKILKAFSVCAS